MFFAHSLEDNLDKSRWQTLRDHLYKVAQLASERGTKFGAARAATLAGQLHDLGKYSFAFQKRLEGGPRVDHATAGAREVLRLRAQSGADRIIYEVVAHTIVGHHAGLPDSLGDDRSLDVRLKKEIEPLDPIWHEEIKPVANGLAPIGFTWAEGKLPYQFAFLGRMLFSCLVDADFRDTERFYAQAEGHSVDRDWPRLPEIVDDLISRFDRYMRRKQAGAADTPVNRLRAEILAHVLARAEADCGLFTLTVPTGGGKTLASLAFALKHAKRHRLERIIYAIPFTSIIDQTAAVFREVFEDGANPIILEHHSAIDEERIEDEDHSHRREARDKLRLAMEDWAAPIVVTTNVQVFESLHSNRPSRCRRLHNLTKAVIILDEAQTIPRPLLRPCLAALDELTRNYGASIIFCTATQPALNTLELKNVISIGTNRELAPDPLRLHRNLKRVRLKHFGERIDDQLIAELGEMRQGLVIVNSRAHALALYRKAVEAGLEGAIHLTTRQYAIHRRCILDDVRARLKDGAPCRLIATSLVEAGVDLDFPCVFRAEAGLEQIAQAAGRCNREGSRRIAESIVGVFRSPEHQTPHEIAQLAGDMERIMKDHADDLLSPAAISDYFGEGYWRVGEEGLDRFNVLDAYRVSAGRVSFEYRRVGENFRMIESGLAPVIVPIEPRPRDALNHLRRGFLPAGAAARKLQSYIVPIPPKARNLLLANGHVRFVEGFGDQFAELVTLSLYHAAVGLLWESADYLAVENTVI
jgi:CRISPR-associated endonuclease/helicase Cas3